MGDGAPDREFEARIVDTPVVEPSLDADVGAERCVLGAMMIDPTMAVTISEQLTGQDFFEPRHQTIYEMIRNRSLGGELVDAVAVAHALLGAGQLTKVGGGAYLHTLIASVPTAASATHYAAIVSEKAVRRRLWAAHVTVGQRIKNPAFTASEAATGIEDMYATAAVPTHGRIREGNLQHVLDQMVEAFTNGTKRDPGLTIGLPTLDQHLHGIRPGYSVIIAGRPGAGKTTLVTEIVRHIGLTKKQPILFFSMEMSLDDITAKIVSADSGCSLIDVQADDLNVDQWARVHDTISRLREAPLHIVDQSQLSIDEIRAYAKVAQRRHGLAAIIIDQLSFIRPPAIDNREQQVAYISRNIKALAKDLKLPVFTCAQLNREGEARNNKEPRLTDLRESDAIAADADIVIFVHRPSYWDPDDRPGEVDFIIAKHRYGKTGKVAAVAQLWLSRFADMP